MKGWIVKFGLGAAVALAAPFSLAGTVEVAIGDYRFDPVEVRIRIGDTVKWVNREKRTAHSVLFAGPGGFESERFFPGDSWQRTFDKAGRYPYSCGPHPEMKGVVEVAE